MAIILSIETSTITSSIAIHMEGNLISSQDIHVKQSHSSRLIPSIKFLAEASNIELQNIDVVAISKGPGSYTGLRIGTSAAKGLCYGLDAKLIAINTLDAMAHQLNKSNVDNSILCPMIDARRMEVYCKLIDSNFSTIQKTSAIIIDKNAFATISSDRRILYFGDGAAKCIPELKDNQNLQFIPGISTSAVTIGELAWNKYETSEFENLAYFEPFYLKDFKAKKPSAKKLV